METRAAAPPPTPLKMATSWGMAVMRTRRDDGRPDHGADDHADRDDPVRAGVLVDQGQADRDHHAADADQVAPCGPAAGSSGP